MQRVLVQLVVTSMGVITKAFLQAYSQARAGGGAAGRAASAAGGAANSMDLSQARQILQVGRTPTAEEVSAQFTKYFNANDPDKGGSFYLQSKISNAKDALLEDLTRKRAAERAAKAAAAAGAGKAPLR